MVDVKFRWHEARKSIPFSSLGSKAQVSDGVSQCAAPTWWELCSHKGCLAVPRELLRKGRRFWVLLCHHADLEFGSCVKALRSPLESTFTN